MKTVVVAGRRVKKIAELFPDILNTDGYQVLHHTPVRLNINKKASDTRYSDELKIHLCPILMRTVRFVNGYCTEKCEEECPFVEMGETDGL